MKNALRIVVVVASLMLLTVINQAQQLTRVRVAHFSPDTPAVEVYLNGEFSGIQALNFGDISGWVELPAGTYSVAVAPAGTSVEQAAIGPVDLTLTPGGWFTVNAIGSLGSGTLTASVASEPYRILDTDEASVTVFHGIEDAPAVDVILTDGTVLVSGLTFGNSTNITVPAGVYDLAVVPSGTTSPVVIDLSGTALNARTFYYVGATNQLAAPQVALSAIGFGLVENLIDKEQLPTIVEIAAGDSRFDTLVAALQATGLDAALAGDGPFTVFAPTDEAFADLLATLGITADELLADTDLLTSVLLYHVSPTRAFANDVVGVTGLATLQGSGINVGIDNQGVALDFTTRLLQTDIEGSNGVIHVIDEVLLPSR
ncbi:MAG: DUF4397 domain-containing protein [Chloroflexota bacterium]